MDKINHSINLLTYRLKMVETAIKDLSQSKDIWWVLETFGWPLLIVLITAAVTYLLTKNQSSKLFKKEVYLGVLKILNTFIHDLDRIQSNVVSIVNSFNNISSFAEYDLTVLDRKNLSLFIEQTKVNLRIIESVRKIDSTYKSKTESAYKLIRESLNELQDPEILYRPFSYLKRDLSTYIYFTSNSLINKIDKQSLKLKRAMDNGLVDFNIFFTIENYTSIRLYVCDTVKKIN